MASLNATAAHLRSTPFDQHPFYYSPRPSVIPGVPDVALALATPILAHWIVSAFFHVLDTSGWKWLHKYRIHDSPEVASRNLVTPREVVRAVIFQQLVQIVLGSVWMSETQNQADHFTEMTRLFHGLESAAERVLGDKQAHALLKAIGPQTAYFMYWWLIPAFQLLVGMFVMDSWQYWLHRLMHTSKFMYKHFHSVHHRLYVPYAFASLYNHPIEGLIVDSLGAVLSESASGMTVRQSAFFFALANAKAVDDHCGYQLPFDPLQIFFKNTADYHDIHHQTAGMKSNFAQPFFVHWDALLGTRMTRKEMEANKSKKA